MTAYGYSVAIVRVGGLNVVDQATLDNYGAQGWEAVQMTAMGEQHQMLAILFRQPVEG